jgi:hypothetical protein
MKRLFVLLLICLLPMQVFAGALTHSTSETVVTAVAAVLPVTAAAQLQAQLQEQLQDQAIADLASDDGIADGASYGDSGEDFSTHAGIGDEPMQNPALIFGADSASLAPAQRSDAARQPPFLPPAARPPRA